jgi:hypothetical protein
MPEKEGIASLVHVLIGRPKEPSSQAHTCHLLSLFKNQQADEERYQYRMVKISLASILFYMH